jgi:phage terminase small subunit
MADEHFIDGPVRKLTPQQENFCQEYIKNKCNASEAYRQAYNCQESGDNTIWVNASRLLNDTKVSLRIQTLQAEAAERNKVTVDSLTEELNEAKMLAYQLEQVSAGVSAIMGKAKIHGLDKTIISGDLNLKTVRVINMTGKDSDVTNGV